MLLSAGGGGFSLRGRLIARQDLADEIRENGNSILAAKWRVERESIRFVKQLLVTASIFVSLVWRVQHPSEIPSAVLVYIALRIGFLGITLLLTYDTFRDRLRRRELSRLRNRRSTDHRSDSDVIANS